MHLLHFRMFPMHRESFPVYCCHTFMRLHSTDKCSCSLCSLSTISPSDCLIDCLSLSERRFTFMDFLLLSPTSHYSNRSRSSPPNALSVSQDIPNFECPANLSRGRVHWRLLRDCVSQIYAADERSVDM